ncbi:hypothetical protein [Streptomyces milbemycinicus]|uniref:hypothetical protein n=1 Tax=Streptomyces milbemycinicus TaxID=476552 RepID=UPI000A362666|nr:hypothetical protein [Streptomyces milbemycinicus]
MGCGCGGVRKQSTGARAATRKGKTTYQVVLDGGNGRVAFTTTNVTLAGSVSVNYPGSVVLPLGATNTPPAATKA